MEGSLKLKSSEIKLQLELKNIKNYIFDNFKHKKYAKYTQKKTKNSKGHVRRPQIKKFRKQIVVRIEQY